MQNYNEYKFSPIRMHIPLSGEVFNIGVILTDETEQKKIMKTINSFSEISDCINLKEINGHNYMLKKLQEDFNSGDVSFGKSFSNAIYIEELDWLNSDKEMEDELNIMFDELVTLKRKEAKRSIGKYTNKTIISELRKISDKKKMKNIYFRRSTKYTHKKVDTITLGDEDDIIVAGEVCSPYVDDFMDNFASSIFLLNQLNNLKKMKAGIVYLPLMMDLNKLALKKNYSYARDYAKEIGYEVVTSKHLQEYIDAIADMTKRDGQSLF